MNEPFEKYKDVNFCGILYTHSRNYWLLYPKPIEKDSWQTDDEKRFLVVPMEKIGTEIINKEEIPLFAYPRHIVTTSPYLIEYNYVKDKIRVMDLGDYSAEQKSEVDPDQEYWEELFGDHV